MNKANAQALANSARGLIALLQDNCKMTMAGTITEWNICVKQAEFFGVFDFPTTGYTRKAQLIADLMRCAEQLDYFDEVAHETARSANRIADVNEAHDAAFLAEFGIAACRRVQLFPETVISPYEAHAEALEIHNALALLDMAKECITELNNNPRNIRAVIANWNAAARHGGFPALQSGGLYDHELTAETAKQMFLFRKNILIDLTKGGGVA